MTDAITQKARAKLNLTLEVVGRRADGLHDIVSVMQTIELHDMLTIAPTRGADEIVFLNCPRLDRAGADSTVGRALNLMRARLGLAQRFRIVIDKRIPLASGLGGGAADAAATLRGINKLMNLKMSYSQLAQIGFEVGADAPFCIAGGTALVTGAGERMRPLPPIAPPQNFALIVLSRTLPSKTKNAYAKLAPSDWSDGARAAKAQATIKATGRFNMKDAFNAFQAVIFETAPETRAHWDAWRRDNATEIAFTGAGPTMFAALERKDDLERLKRYFPPDKFNLIATRTDNHDAE